MNTKKGEQFNRLTQLQGLSIFLEKEWDFSLSEESVDYYVNMVKRYENITLKHDF